MPPKNQIYFIIAMFIPFFLMLVFFAIYPIFKSIQNHSSELSSIKNEIQLINQQNKEVADFKKKYESYKDGLANLQSLFVGQQNPVDFIEFIEKTAREENVTDFTKSIVQDPKQKTEGPIEFKISFSGSFSNIIGFAEKVEKGPYLVKIDQLKINQVQDTLSADILLLVQ